MTDPADSSPPPGDAAPSDQEPCPLGAGDVLAQRYAVEQFIGEGTFGWVLAAIDLVAVPPRRVALKVLRRRYALREDIVRRFERRELALLLRVQEAAPTPHVVRALEATILKHGALPYLVLEFIDGPSLREALTSGALGPVHVRRLGVGIAQGLAAIHAARGVHRDLKPTNIRLRGGSEPVIVDLGVSRALWETQEATEPGPAPMTPRYASPEQLAGREASPASDIYSLGVVLYELLTGHVPRQSDGAVPSSRVEGHPIASDLREVVMHCLDQSPEQRPSALEVVVALSAPSANHWRSRGLRWGGGVGAVLLLVLMGAIGVLRITRPPVQAPVLPVDESNAPWSLRLGDDKFQSWASLALDAQGDVLVGGTFQGSVDLGRGLLVSEGDDDIFLARLSPEGRTLWSRRFGGAGPQVLTSIAVGSQGHIAVTGGFMETLDFGRALLFSPVDSDIFLARLDPEGNLLWSQRFGAEGGQRGSAVAVDPTGHIILTGIFQGTVDFGRGPLVNTGAPDLFLARFSADGQLLWGLQFEDAGTQEVTSLAVDQAGNIAVAGRLHRGMDLVFVALFGPDGHHRWSQGLGGTQGEAHVFVTFDTADHLVLAGSARGLVSEDAADNFVARFTPEGVLVWRRRIGDPERQIVTAIATGPSNQIVLTGGVEGSTDPGDGPFEGVGGQDVFVLELASDGTLLSARRFGDDADQRGLQVAVDLRGRVLLAGSFDGALDVGSGRLSSAGAQDLFISRLELRAADDTLESGHRPPVGDCIPPPVGLVAWYPFDSPDMDAAAGSAPRGRLVGNASSPAAGRVQGAMDLGGFAYFEVPDTETLDFGRGDLSISAWIRTTSIDEAVMLIDKRVEAPSGGPVIGYSVQLRHGRLSFSLAHGGGSGHCQMTLDSSCTNYHSGYFVADGAWHFVGVTVDRDDPDGGIFYVDGMELSRFDPTLRSGTLSNSGPFRVGSCSRGLPTQGFAPLPGLPGKSRSRVTAPFFRGLIDEVALWNRVLGPTEVASLYGAASAGMCRAQSSALSRSP